MADVELVIRMPEHYYENNIKRELPICLSEDNVVAILPKGHGRLKDVDWIDDNCDHHRSDEDGSWCYAWKDIDGAPTLIEADTEGREDSTRTLQDGQERE